MNCSKTHAESKILPKCQKFYTSVACDACDKYQGCTLPTPECRKSSKSGNADDGSFAKLLGLSVLDIPNLGAQSTSCHLKSWKRKFLSKRLRGWANHLGTSEVPLSGLEPPFRSYNRGKVICEREKMAGSGLEAVFFFTISKIWTAYFSKWNSPQTLNFRE